VLDYAGTMHEEVWEEGWLDPRFPDLGFSCRLVNFTPRLLYHKEMTPVILGCVDRRSSLVGEEKRQFFTIPTLELRLLSSRARNQ
jgi:hypothetical protein